MKDKPRLIERAFPLKQASLDSVHEKNVRHGHISTLHIWPARRPLAACRAALIATLLPDPGTPEERQKLCEKIGGKVVQRIEKKKMPNGRSVERIKELTEGGILHWKRETENAETLEWFRKEIRKVYGGRAPRVLDPFAGGGAIPLEAMRLGCEATAVDINPVAWFILKCTLEYPQKLAGKTHPLPEFILEDEEFMEAFYKAHPHLIGKTKRTKKQMQEFRTDLFMKDRLDSGTTPEADLAWQVRAWGKWVLNGARQDLAKFYPTYADFEPLKHGRAFEKQPMRLVPLKDDGTPDPVGLNAEFSEEYLADKRNPRWVPKPTVAYLWARTVTCKNCRATVPLLKTRWLCKKAGKRVLLTMEPNTDKTGVVFGVEEDVPTKGGNAAQRREHDRRLAAGTMSRAGAWCPCCQKPGQVIMTMEDIRLEGKSGRLDATLTAVVAQAPGCRHYRLPTNHEVAVAEIDHALILARMNRLPHGSIEEALEPASHRSISCNLYGIDSFAKMFSARQTYSLATFGDLAYAAEVEMRSQQYTDEWISAIKFYLSAAHDRMVDRSSVLCSWDVSRQNVRNTFGRFALPMVWDYCESISINESSGSYFGAVALVGEVIEHCATGTSAAPQSRVRRQSATEALREKSEEFDIIITDPPYYEAISYADMADFFFVWLKRTLQLEGAHDGLTPKRQEAVQHIHPDKERSVEKAKYEQFMADAFRRCFEALSDTGRFVIVFAHKHPDAWETLVSAMIQAGFVVDGSWPIQTEMGNRSRGQSAASLASSVWLVCKKRPSTARPGWDNKVIEEMRANIATRLREFWDAGIRGPDFVWAATGPGLEAYSKHPVVKKANDAGKTMEVSEFLSHVRRMVVDFVVGQVLTGDGAGADLAAADRMDAPTAYYLLHRHDFGLEEAPSGACILYATACGLSDSELESTWDILVRTGSSRAQDEDEVSEEADPDAEADPDSASDSSSKVKLKTWAQRKHKSMGYEAPGGQPVPLIDRIHRLMHLWRAGDVLKVDEYLDEHGLRRQELFRRLLQSLIELSPRSSDERTLLESLSNHVQAKGATPEDRQATMAFGQED